MKFRNDNSAFRLSRVSARLLTGAALAAVLAPAGVLAQNNSSVETVTVTGTNIRGTAPVGEPLIAIDRAAIENSAAVSVQQLLQTSAPQVNGFGSAGQSNGSFEPRIRGIGGSSSGATLVLVDGHRINLGGGNKPTKQPHTHPP